MLAKITISLGITGRPEEKFSSTSLYFSSLVRFSGADGGKSQYV